MGKETFVQPAHFPIDSAAYHQRGTGGPEQRGGFVVLALINLYGAHHAATAIGIAPGIDETTTGPGVLEACAVPLAAQFGLTGRHFGMGLQIVQHGAKPVRPHFHVVVQ